MNHVLRSRLRDQEGATAVEYGIMVALIAVVIIFAVAALGGSLSGIFSETCSEIAAETENFDVADCDD